MHYPWVPLPKRQPLRWPGGKIVTADVPPSAREIELNAVGKLKVVR